MNVLCVSTIELLLLYYSFKRRIVSIGHRAYLQLRWTRSKCTHKYVEMSKPIKYHCMYLRETYQENLWRLIASIGFIIRRPITIQISFQVVALISRIDSYPRSDVREVVMKADGISERFHHIQI